MENTQFIDRVAQGHFLYWDMLGAMRGMENHKGDICYLTGDIHYSYATRIAGPDCDA